MDETTACTHCHSDVSGEEGHKALSFYVDGPFPGQRIFRCIACDERWIRHCGPEGGPAWTRYSDRFPVRKPRATSASPKRVLV